MRGYRASSIGLATSSVRTHSVIALVAIDGLE